MRGSIDYCLEREPAFFAQAQMQGRSGADVAIIERGGRIVAMAAMVEQEVWLEGERQSVAYLGDLKVDTDHRNEGLASRLIRFLTSGMRSRAIERAFFLTLEGNRAFRNLDRHRVRRQRSICNFIVPLMTMRSGSRNVIVTRARPVEIPQMIELWNRVNRQRSFAPVLDEHLLDRWQCGDVAISDFRLVWKDNQLIGFCAPWDPSPIKQIRLLRLSPSLRILTALHDVVASLQGKARFPNPGEYLQFIYLSHLCADRPEAVAALLDEMHRDYSRTQHLYLDFALDRDDPLTEALNRYRFMTVGFDLWEANLTGRPRPIDTTAYFDVSLV